MFVFCIIKETFRGHQTTLLSSSRQNQNWTVQETQWLLSVQSSLSLRMRHVQEIIMSFGSEQDHTNLTQTSSTLMEIEKTNVRKDQRLRKTVFITSLKISALLMLGHTTALWPHVERLYLEMELQWNLVWLWIKYWN